MFLRQDSKKNLMQRIEAIKYKALKSEKNCFLRC